MKRWRERENNVVQLSFTVYTDKIYNYDKDKSIAYNVIKYSRHYSARSIIGR